MEQKTEGKKKRQPTSKLRKAYIARLVGRCIVLVLAVLLYILKPDHLNVLHGMNFFREFSPLHILWGIWIVDMVCQLVPMKKHIPLGSQKLFKEHYRPSGEKINYEKLKNHVITTTKSAYKVFVIWFVAILIIGLVYYFGILKTEHLFLISVAFYVCDLICVLIWCPFRLLMKNRCCTTCRIFNWDHMMMFTPMLFVNSFYSVSLMLLAFIVWVLWEGSVMLYPERFWERSNTALRCSECTDKLCTQYCRKLRK